MIPLNKAGYFFADSTHDYLSKHFIGYNTYILSNAGDGLNLAYQKLYEERGSLRIGVSPLACVLAIYPIVMNGHIPVFIDIDSETFNMDAQKLISRNDIDAVEVIYLGGNPCEMDIICKWAKDNGKIIIEDCAQALGSFYDGVEAGNFGDYAAFSLIKNLLETTGGLFVSKQIVDTCGFKQIPLHVIAYRELKRFLESHTSHNGYNPWNFLYRILLQIKESKGQRVTKEVHRLDDKRSNYLIGRFSNIKELNARRINNANEIIKGLDSSRYQVQKILPKGVSNRNRLFLRIISGGDAQTTIGRLRKKGIAANNLTQHYLNGFQPHILKDNLLSDFYHKKDLEVYDAIFNAIIAVPSSPYLSSSEKKHIIDTLNNI